MAYLPIAQNLPNGAVFTTDHIAHIESGILNADVDSREYIDGIAQQIQAGQVTDPAFDAAVDRALADGRLVVEGSGSAEINVTEVQQGVYDLTSGLNSATIYGLTSAQTLPAAAKTDLRTDFPTKLEIQESGFLTSSSVASPAPGEYTIGSAIVQGLTTDKKLPDAAKVDLEGRFPTRDLHRLNLRELGAPGDATFNNATFQQAISTARSTYRSNPLNPTGDKFGTKVIDIPAGDYKISDIKGLWGNEGLPVKVSGLRFRGAGIGLTNIIFDPATPGPLAFNDYWHNIWFEGMTFRATTAAAGSTFLQSYTTHSAQRYTFVDVEWIGPWKYVFDLQGNDNNSEFLFIGCTSSFVQANGAFLYIGATNTSDQFLNYWFYGHKHWSTSSPLIDAARGGHFHIFGLDASDWGAEATAAVPRYLFNLRGFTHARGTEAMTVDGLRVEAKSNDARLIYSEWPAGNVSIQCDWSSQVDVQTYGDIIVLNLGNVSGAVYNFHDSHLAGGIRVLYGTEAFRRQHKILVQNTRWVGKLTPSEVVSYDRSGNGGNVVDPVVEFIHCQGTNATPWSSPGIGVWDASIGWGTGDLVKPLRERSLSVRDTPGNVKDGGALHASLPVGALITGITAFAPAGSTTEADGGTFTLSTTEATPTVITSAEITGARSAGYMVKSTMTAPYLCNTREKATVKLTSSGVAQSGLSSVVTIHGYW